MARSDGVAPSVVALDVGVDRVLRKPTASEGPMDSIEQLIRELPPDLRQEVRDFAEFLVQRRRQKAGTKLRQDWAGALRDYRDQYTALELQKRALEWRGD
jgi:hypothetical protein